MPEVMPSYAPAPSASGDEGGLLIIDYDPTGRVSANVIGLPLIGWNIDSTTPINPVPIVIGNPLSTPPNTGAIESPAWAHAVTQYAVYVPEPNAWRGSLLEFFTWLATNNGANRLLSASFAWPSFRNTWAAWVRLNPTLVGP